MKRKSFAWFDLIFVKKKLKRKKGKPCDDHWIVKITCSDPTILVRTFGPWKDTCSCTHTHTHFVALINFYGLIKTFAHTFPFPLSVHSHVKTGIFVDNRRHAYGEECSKLLVFIEVFQWEPYQINSQLKTNKICTSVKGPNKICGKCLIME